MKCILFSARQYSFAEEGTGRQVQGVTLQYTDGFPVDTPDQRGLFPLSVSVGSEFWDKVRQLPGVYEMDFRQRPGKNNRAVLSLVNLTFVSPLPVETFLE